MTDKRWGDPEAWSCLDDEQRDIIKKWYDGICESKREQEAEIYKRCKAAALDPSICMIAWVTGAMMGRGTFFQTALTAVASIILFYGGTGILYEAGIMSREDSTWRRISMATISIFVSVWIHN